MHHQAPDTSELTREGVELELGDGSRLILEQHLDCRVEGDACISLSDAMGRGGQPFAGYRHLGRAEVTA